MPIIINGTTVKKVVTNGTNCKVVNCNGVQVFNAEENIYNAGSTNTSLIGSWSNQCSGNASVSFESARIHFFAAHVPSYNYWGHAIIWTNSKINLSSYSKIHMKVSTYTNTPYMRVHIHSSIVWSDNPQANSSTKYATVHGTGTGGSCTVTLDVSNVTGSYHIGFDITPEDGWGSGTDVYVTRIWLE